jgi:hypothetical protein
MKLNPTQVKQALNQFNAEALPDNHPSVPQLNSIFGDHTFFLDDTGLNVLEPAQTPEMNNDAGEIVNLAYWNNAERNRLKPHEPEPTGVMVVLESKH